MKKLCYILGILLVISLVVNYVWYPTDISNDLTNQQIENLKDSIRSRDSLINRYLIEIDEIDSINRNLSQEIEKLKNDSTNEINLHHEIDIISNHNPEQSFEYFTNWITEISDTNKIR